MSEAGSHNPLSDHLDQAMLADELSTVLRETVFSSSLCVSPRRVAEIGKQFALVFFEYYDHADDPATQAYGQQLANEGLGPRSVLRAVAALQRVCTERSNPLKDLPFVASTFSCNLLDGYIAAREKRLLEDQERSRKAELAVMGRQQSAPD